MQCIVVVIYYQADCVKVALSEIIVLHLSVGVTVNSFTFHYLEWRSWEQFRQFVIWVCLPYLSVNCNIFFSISGNVLGNIRRQAPEY